MAIPKNINKDHLLQAISKIDSEGIPKDANSQYYDIVYNNKRYPGKLIISYANLFANGIILDRNSFPGGIGTRCFKILEENGFVIENKTGEKYQGVKVWIEKTLVSGRDDRMNGERALGRALWSPQKDERGGDIYKNMRAVQMGDLVIHLIDNRKISGISVVKEKVIETNGLGGTDWSGPAYLIELINYTKIDPEIDRAEILNDIYAEELLEINEFSEVFYTKELKLRQGAYLTPCPIELLNIINKAYKLSSNKELPFIEKLNLENINSTSMDNFNIFKLKESLLNSGLKFSDKLFTRFVSSLITKPFVILTGLSGSGKTKLAQALAMCICGIETQYCLVPVGADWTNREPLLGFPNALEPEKYVKPDNKVLDLIINAVNDPEKPYFLILDEMNLSHVERYFADFLSVMESNNKIPLHDGEADWNDIPSKIELPKNLFIIGTVNIDETTYMFSPKVLDRANVIEFRVSSIEMEEFFNSYVPIKLENLEFKCASMAKSFVKIAKDKSLKSKHISEISATLIKFFNELKKTGAEFGYRSASEILRFSSVVNIIAPDWSTNEIIDIAVMQKLLPKVHGSRKKLEGVLLTLAKLCVEDSVLKDKDFKIENLLNTEGLDAIADKLIYPVSFEKISRMYKGLLANGFTSYAEA